MILNSSRILSFSYPKRDLTVIYNRIGIIDIFIAGKQAFNIILILEKLLILLFLIFSILRYIYNNYRTGNST